MKYIELFDSIQGEGQRAGFPSIFVRVSGCNLRCVFGESICDTDYASFNAKPGKFTDEDVIQFIIDHPNINDIVITGGEPMLYKKQLIELLKKINNTLDKMLTDNILTHYYTVTIETNGTIEPFSKEDMHYIAKDSHNPHYLNILYSISPKLSTSVDKDCKVLSKEEAEKHDKTRINIPALYKYLKLSFDNAYKNEYLLTRIRTQFKYVYSNEDSVKEIKEINDSILKYHNEYLDKTFGTECITPYEPYDKLIDKHLNDIIYLMPEGISNEMLQHTRELAVKECLKNGWRYTDRMQIIIWGNTPNT